ncbi:hypothetical protein PENTCL1PPCAC_20124 [Pristionchus entomophagus]|uniref:Uncharacterized protein n=1 Tax=Pristionchus entomophagus TaxID=358040 RepID=A0AAV5TU26_9BILA|nr:hypothetical protein PENTCL1PPCAC_20124 [Pristionchus entomophagus]
MMKITVVLLAALSLQVARCDDYDEPKPVSCEDRCLRIHERSLERIGFSKVGADRYIDKPNSDQKTMRGVCWKQYDYFYCMKGCKKSLEHEKYARHVKSRCKHSIEDLETGLSCLFKYRSFLEIRCSSFLNEAIRLKQADEPDLLPDRETCRYLHLNALCLENSVGSFCPQATPFFRRLNLRDFFLNHILPPDDELFDDEDLDSCQMKDFVKEALEGVKVSPRRMGEEEETTTTSQQSSSSPSSTNVSYELDDDEDDDDSEESWPASSTPPPAIVRTLSPSTRGHSSVQTSTTSNFVYTTPTRKQASSTLVGTVATSAFPIHITKEQAMRTSTARAGEQRGQRITVTPKSLTTTTTVRPTTTEPSSTTSRRRLFDSDEDFSQTPPNFLWGSFRGENYKLARNYSESFPPDAQFVTPVTVESSSTFGDEDGSRDDSEDYGNPQVIDIDRDEEPVTVTGKPVKTTTIVRLIDEKRKSTAKRVDEDRSSPVYEHAVDTQLQPTTLSRRLHLEPAEATTILWKPESTTTLKSTSSKESSTESRVLPTDSDVDEDDGDDENEIRIKPEPTEDAMEDSKSPAFHPATHGFAVVDSEELVDRNEAENNFDRALQLEKEDDDSNEMRTGVDEQLEFEPIMITTTSTTSEPFTPLINGGRVAVKSIKQFKAIGEEESSQDWTEDPNVDDSHVDLGDVDDYDKEVYLTSEMLPDESRDSEIRRRINFILAYTSLFFILLLLVVCCVIVVIVKNRRNVRMDDRPYKMHDSL